MGTRANEVVASLAQVLATGLALGLPSTALAHAEAEPMCPGCPGMWAMWIGAILVGLLIVAVIAALVALAVFLIKRIGPRAPRHA